MIIKFVMKFLPTCLPSGLTVAAPDAFGRIPGVRNIKQILTICVYLAISDASTPGLFQEHKL